MCRRFTLREACNQLGLIDDLSDDDDNGEDAEFIPVEDDEVYAEFIPVRMTKRLLRMTGRLLLMMKEISKHLKREMIMTQMMMKPLVTKLQIRITVMEKVVLLTAYRVKVAFRTQPMRFLIEDDVEISLHNDPELLLPLKLKSKVLSICSQKK